MNANLKMKFNNTYRVELIDANTDKVRQSGVFHNIVTKDFGALLSTSVVDREYIISSGSSSPCAMLYSLKVGSGTTTPSKADTALSSTLWQAYADSRSMEWLDDYTARGTATFTFPATSSYVGSVTEVGLFDYTSRLCTRSLLTDSEGQSISFNKTDTDILKVTVTVELSITSNTEAFKIFKKSLVVGCLLLPYVTDYPHISRLGRINLCRYYNDMQIFRPLQPEHGKSNPSIDQRISADVYGFRSDTECYVRYNVGRLLATDITDERYYKCIAIPGLGYWELPNEDIFPTYSITGISIGTGDGTTTSFENPLNYFKKDTDKIYKNGVQLTRGTDYTINNLGNKDCLPEVAELIPPIKVYSEMDRITTLSVAPIGLASSLDRDETDQEFSQTFSNNYPLYIEYENDVTLNCLKCTGGLKKFNGTNVWNNMTAGTMFYLDKSIDGVTYEEVASAATDSDAAFTMDFADTTAKYWRIRTSSTYEVGMFNDSNAYMTLNRKDPYIVFAEAPAEGDVLTMDVDMDVIMKNSNFVVDVGCRIDFSF